MELGHQRRAGCRADREPLGRALAVYAAFDVEKGVKTLDGFERDRVDHAAALTTAPLTGGAYDIDRFEQLAPRMCEAAGLEQGTRVAALAVEVVVAAMGIGVQHAGQCHEMGLRVIAAPIARVVERGHRWIALGKWAIIADVDP